MSQSNQTAIGLDVGGTKILAGLVDAEGNVLRSWRYETPTDDGGSGILRGLADALQEVLSSLGSERSRVVGAGVSTAGHVNHETGAVEYCTPNLPGWSGTQVAEVLERRVSLPVSVDNDGNAAAYGEYWCGAGRGHRMLIAITLGTGLGGGVVADGKLIRGARGGGAELGHMILQPDGLPCNCGQAGCLESYVSGTALERAAERAGLVWSSRDIFDKARAGDTEARRLVDEMAQSFAVGLTTIVNAYDPDRIVVGGGVGEQSDLFLPMVRIHLARRIGDRGWSPDWLIPARLGEYAGMIGAAGQAHHRFGAVVPA